MKKGPRFWYFLRNCRESIRLVIFLLAKFFRSVFEFDRPVRWFIFTSRPSRYLIYSGSIIPVIDMVCLRRKFINKYPFVSPASSPYFPASYCIFIFQLNTFTLRFFIVLGWFKSWSFFDPVPSLRVYPLLSSFRNLSQYLASMIKIIPKTKFKIFMHKSKK